MNTQNYTAITIGKLKQSDVAPVNTLIDSDILFKNSDVIAILHKGEQYQLRRTRNGKLILNK